MNIRTRFYLILGLVVVSLYTLVPTFGGFEGRYQQAESGAAPLPGYVKPFPRKGINLGLDLRGGIYVELEVVLEDALKHKSDLISSEIERFTQKENFKPELVTRSGVSEIVLNFKDNEGLKGFTSYLRENYHNVLMEKGNTNTSLTVDLVESVKDYTKDQSVRQALETIRNRIDRYGVAEPSIVRVGSNKIAVELPGAKDPERAINIIKRAGKLEFKMVDETIPASDVQQWVKEARDSLGLPEGFKEEQILKINEALKGKIPESDEVLFEVQYDPVTKKIAGGVPYLLKAKSELTGDMLRHAQVNIQNNEPYVSLSFDNTGTKLFADLTKANVGKRLAIILDGNVSKAPVIQSEIPSGEAQITLGFGNYQELLREAEDLALVLREGALPASLKELTKTIVGPSLGKDSIERGIKATLAAAIVIVLFMVFYYRLSGLMADLSLLLNMIFLLAALALFQATLTLPGIAGIVLTLGMAVDANVLTFERMREEIRSGKSPHAALEAGYSNAMSAILDSNITTFLSGVVLYQFGTGPIRGFAVTLMIGIMTTLFTAIIVTRVLQEWYLSKFNPQKLSV